MERLGTADRVAQGLLVVRADAVPDLGGDVVDEDLTDVGTIVDVFGPVDRPYVAVSPSMDHPALAVGSPLYVR